MKKLTLADQKDIYERVIKLLVIERDYWEARTKFPKSLSILGWRMPELWEIRKYYPEFFNV